MSSAVDTGAMVTGVDKVVVIALGNRFRGDDGIGPIIAERLKENAERLKNTVADRPGGQVDGCTIVEGKDDAMALVSAWENAALAVVIDAAVSGAAPGTIRRLEAGAQPLSKDVARCSSHGLGLAEAVELGKALGRLPARLVIFAVEAGTLEQGGAMSPEVTAAADEVVRIVEAEVASFGNAWQTSKRQTST
ncbi:MAG TPA: hydrogenase maturation protease [Burkholderiales bacterium]|nr:hydrogenase maturation protease [Burkholderiales bacterium]